MFCRNIETIDSSDLEDHPVWEFAADEEEEDDLRVQPVGRIPVYDLGNRLVMTRVHLANGLVKWARLGNISLWSKETTNQFATIAIFHDKRWIPLARYHDPGFERWGPSALAEKLGLGLNDVFPITYDIRECCVGDPGVVVGTFTAEPEEKLSWDDVQKLIRGS